MWLKVALYYSLLFVGADMRPLSCAADKFADGCSVPTIIPAPFKNEFTPACNRHDICYACGNHYNWSRLNCDNSFFNDMNIICDNLKEKRSLWDSLIEVFNQMGNKRSQCHAAARGYYEVVHLFAESHFDRHEHDYCTSLCAENHGNPRLNITI